MEIEAAIQQYLMELKQAAPRERVEFDLIVLARLEEYLLGDTGQDAAESVSAADLQEFVRAWYREEQDVTPEVTEWLVGAVLGWAGWLDRRFAAPSRLPLAPALAPLEEHLPRVARAAEALRRYVRREDLGEGIPVAEAAGGSPLGTISAGISRVVRPVELDYVRAEEDTFEVVEIGEQSVALLSPARAQLGQGRASPVAVPRRVTGLLRVGDILHGEIVPAGAGWEIVNVVTVYPGGLDDRP